MAARIVELSSAIHAAEGELVGLLAEFHAAKGWQGAGIRSLEHWLCVNAGFTLTEGRSRAALSDRAGELPHLMGALRAGVLSLGAARQASRVATSELDDRVTEIATTATATQAARIFRTYTIVEEAERRRRRCPVDADTAVSGGGETDPGDGRGSATWWRHWWDDHGFLNVDGRLDPSGGAELVAAIDSVAATLGADRRGGTRPDGSGSPAAGATAPEHPDADPAASQRSPVSRVDAVGELAAAALAGLRHRGFTGRGGERFSVHVTIDAATLAGIGAGTGVFDSGRRVDAALVRSWLGEARLDLLVHDQGRPLWAGRDQRVATTAQRRALFQRDRGCAHPGCDHTRFVDAHHIRSWEDGGGTDIDNMVLLCRHHHRLLHAGEYQITMIDGRPRFEHPDRTTLETRHPRRRPPPLTPPARPEQARRSGEPLTDYALDVYLANLLGN